MRQPETVLKALAHSLPARALGVLTLLVGVLLSVVPWPGIGSLVFVLVELLVEQGRALGVRIYTGGPGSPGVSLVFATAPLVGLTLATPALAYQVLVRAAPTRVRSSQLGIALAALGVSLAFIVGIAIGYVLVVPLAIDWIAGFARSPSSPSTMIWFPAYVDLVANLLLWSGLVVQLSAVVVVLARSAAHRGPVLTRAGLASLVLAVLLAVQLGGSRDAWIRPLSQILLAYTAFEAGLVLARFAWRPSPPAHVA